MCEDPYSVGIMDNYTVGVNCAPADNRYGAVTTTAVQVRDPDLR
jgi:hypothetical protein